MISATSHGRRFFGALGVVCTVFSALSFIVARFLGMTSARAYKGRGAAVQDTAVQ